MRIASHPELFQQGGTLLALKLSHHLISEATELLLSTCEVQEHLPFFLHCLLHALCAVAMQYNGWLVTVVRAKKERF